MENELCNYKVAEFEKIYIISEIRKGRLRCLGNVERIPEGRTV
jgi:hypothetical protein